MTEQSTSRIEEALTEWFGERCADPYPGCATCDAWAELDGLKESVTKLQTALLGYLENGDLAKDIIRHTIKTLTGADVSDDDEIFIVEFALRKGSEVSLTRAGYSDLPAWLLQNHYVGFTVPLDDPRNGDRK